jgi:hypothetical protein
LAAHTEGAVKKMPGALVQAYCIVVTVSETNEVQAFKIQVGDAPLFQTIKADKRSRITDAAITADAILPGGPYDLWREGEDARRVRDLVGAFARFPRLPKMLSQRAILETIIGGCVEGVFVGRGTRPDKSVRTFWRQRPDEAMLEDPGMEVVLPEKAQLAAIEPSLLYPLAIKDLWTQPELPVQDVQAFFAGGRVVTLDRGGYQEPVAVPRAPTAAVDSALIAGIRAGKLWLTSGPASLLGEDVPAGLLTPSAVVQAPPAPIGPIDLLPDQLPAAWKDGTVNALAIASALSQRAGRNLPWTPVRDAIEGAIRARILELAPASGSWPCDFPAASTVTLAQVSSRALVDPPPRPTVRPGTRVGQADLTSSQIQDLGEVMGDLLKAKAGLELTFHLRVEIASREVPSDAAVEAINAVLRTVNPDIQVT